MKQVSLQEITLSITDGKHGDCEAAENSGYYFVSCKDVNNGTIDYAHSRQISEQAFLETHKRTQLEPNDILITNSGTIGRMALVKDIPETYRTTFQKSVAIVKPDTSVVLPTYLYYKLQNCVADFINRSNGSAQKNLLLGTMRAFQMELNEDYDEQIRLASILVSYDNLIENNQKQIKLLEEAAQRLYKEWFVDFRFPGYENTPIVDGVPEGWSKRSILDNEVFVFVKSSVVPFEGQKRYYATADVNGTQISGNGVLITYRNKPSRAAIQPIKESVWFARMSNSYKILNCYGENACLSENAVISSGFAGFSARKGSYGFVYETIVSKQFDEEKNRYATGATQVSLTNDGLGKIYVLLPNDEIIEEYSKLVEPYMLKAELLKHNIQLLIQARDRLLPKLMNGEIEV